MLAPLGLWSICGSICSPPGRAASAEWNGSKFASQMLITVPRSAPIELSWLKRTWFASAAFEPLVSCEFVVVKLALQSSMALVVVDRLSLLSSRRSEEESEQARRLLEAAEEEEEDFRRWPSGGGFTFWNGRACWQDLRRFAATLGPASRRPDARVSSCWLPLLLLLASGRTTWRSVWALELSWPLVSLSSWSGEEPDELPDSLVTVKLGVSSSGAGLISAPIGREPNLDSAHGSAAAAASSSSCSSSSSRLLSLVKLGWPAFGVGLRRNLSTEREERVGDGPNDWRSPAAESEWPSRRGVFAQGAHCLVAPFVCAELGVGLGVGVDPVWARLGEAQRLAGLASRSYRWPGCLEAGQPARQAHSAALSLLLSLNRLTSDVLSRPRSLASMLAALSARPLTCSAQTSSPSWQEQWA